jgi:hypothetical protein
MQLTVRSLCVLVLVLAIADTGCVARRPGVDKGGGMDEADRKECSALIAPLQAQFSSPASVDPVSPADKAAVFCGIEGRGVFFPTLYTHLTIYGIVDRSTQDRILEVLGKVPRDGFKPIIIRFYERELWTVTYSQDGTTSSQTHEVDREKLLRRALLQR